MLQVGATRINNNNNNNKQHKSSYVSEMHHRDIWIAAAIPKSHKKFLIETNSYSILNLSFSMAVTLHNKYYLQECTLLLADWLLRLFSYPEDGSRNVLRNFGILCTMLHGVTSHNSYSHLIMTIKFSQLGSKEIFSDLSASKYSNITNFSVVFRRLKRDLISEKIKDL
jgi:hypothetical protein